MSENTKKLLEYTGIGILVLILLWLLLSKKAKTQVGQTVQVTPAKFEQTTPQNFAGIPMFNLMPEKFNHYQTITGCNFCPADNYINDYAWGGKSGTA